MRTADLAAVHAWLSDALKAALPGVPVFIGPMPDGQGASDRCIAIMDYPGPPTPNWRAEPRVQIRMRSARPGPQVSPYQDCHLLADSVDSVVAPADQEHVVIPLAGGRQAILRKVSGPMPLGPDSAGRWEMTINVALDYAKA